MNVLTHIHVLLAQASQPSPPGIWTAELVQFYGESLRSSLFAGFLTLGGFLFSAKTFIVVKMKEGVYDTPDYEKSVETQRALKPGSNLKFYGPLRNLSQLLFGSILLSLVTAVAQLTLGLFDNVIAVFICLGLAVATIVVLIISLFFIRANLVFWFDQMEKAKPSPEAETQGDEHS